MDAALEKLTKEQLIDLLTEERLEQQAAIHQLQAAKAQLQAEKAQLTAQLEQALRKLFGQSRERFENPNQLTLPFTASKTAQEKQEAQTRQQQTSQASKEKKTNSNHKGRKPLPKHLPVEEVEIHPEGDLSDQVCIGKEISEALDYIPGHYIIRRYIRYKYVPKTIGETTRIAIADLPERVIDRCKAGSGLLASLLVDKYVDHLPLYRQRQRLLREKIPIASSTLEGWAAQAMERLAILYEHLLFSIKSKGYLQVDETPLKVLESNKKGKCHLGYFWVYHCPLDQTVLFDYQPTRGEKGPLPFLKDFTGYLQTDGYEVYDKLVKNNGKITHLGCWAHARRYFEKALNNDRNKAETALRFIQQLYAVEAEARAKQLSAEQRKDLRLDQALPIINKMAEWMKSVIREEGELLPKSAIGKAFNYTIQRWKLLSAYLYDGSLEIDNNLVENAIRPVALGRKNYLFAGSHKAAQRSAMIYTFFAICKKHEVNPYEWLKHTLDNILSINHKDVGQLLPQNYKSKT